MVNKGLHQYRFKQNPLEEIFAERWEEQNQSSKTLDWILAEDPNEHRDEVTERDREVAASVIQWLGSPVGSSFLKDLMKEVENYESSRRHKEEESWFKSH